ncbi:hypothetical protein TNCV_3061311 [Trichonephila clavipes]|nr:hypothetical protein TNCV_3061311 [Trichonephila clavipes]
MGRIASQKYESSGHVQKNRCEIAQTKGLKIKICLVKANSSTLLLTDCKTIMGLLFVAMLETYPVFSKMLLRLCFIAHQVSRNRCMGSVPSEKIVGATTSEHCLVAKSQKEKI